MIPSPRLKLWVCWLPCRPRLPLQASLSRVLRAYQRVLCTTGLVPESDTRCYRTLLRPSLDREEEDWWGRLYTEVSSNCRWVLACSHAAGAICLVPL